MKIRPYRKDSDFSEICRWSRMDFEGKEPEPSQFSETSFVAEVSDTQMAGVLSVMLTNCKAYCILECLFTNPDLSPRVKKVAIEALASYAELFAKALEYKGLFCWTDDKAMARHYEKLLGFSVGFESAFTLYKRIGG